MLKQARESKGVSLSDIAESTKISTAVLASLEQNDVRALPGGIFTRSFVRSYAGAVGLDPEDTVRAFLEAFPATDAHVGPVYTQPTDEIELFASQRTIRRTAVGLVAISVPIAALLVVLVLSDTSSTAPEAPEAILELGPPRAAGPGSGALERSDIQSVGDDETQTALTRPLVIELHPREACWVSLTLDGNRVFSRVMQPGEHEVHEAAQEIVLNVGNAGVFDFAINQQAGQALGAAGEAVTAHITRGNYRRFLVQRVDALPDAASQ